MLIQCLKSDGRHHVLLKLGAQLLPLVDIRQKGLWGTHRHSLKLMGLPLFRLVELLVSLDADLMIASGEVFRTSLVQCPQARRYVLTLLARRIVSRLLVCQLSWWSLLPRLAAVFVTLPQPHCCCLLLWTPPMREGSGRGSRGRWGLYHVGEAG